MIRRVGSFLAAVLLLSALSPAAQQTPQEGQPAATQSQQQTPAPSTQAPAPAPQQQPVQQPQQQPAPAPQIPAVQIPAPASPAQTPAPAVQLPAPAVTLPAPAGQTPAPDTTVQAAKPQADTVRVELPPAPIRTIVITEKPIKDKPSGIVPPESARTDDASSGDDGTQNAGDSVTTAPGDSSGVAVLPPQQRGAKTPAAAQKKPRKSDTFREEHSIFNRPTENLRTMKVIIDDEYNLVGMVYGESTGFIRVLNADNNGDFTEAWKSPPLNSPVRGVFVDNLDHTGEAEIIAYTDEGNIFIYGYDSHEQKYKTPDGTYQGIACMTIANIDDSPELELLFITKAGKMIQFDTATKFEEWTSTETYKATDIIIGNVDTDPDPEIILNTGEVLNIRFKSVKWKLDSQFIQDNTRLYLVDMDSDGILELVVKYDQQYVRIFDVDQRREKW